MEKLDLVNDPSGQLAFNEKQLRLECLKMADKNHTSIGCNLLDLAAVYNSFVWNGDVPVADLTTR